MRFHVVMWKTLKDLNNFKRTLVYLLVVLSLPFLFATISEDEALLQLETMQPVMQAEFMAGISMILAFVWLAGLPLAVLSAVTCADFIAKEEEDGTLLILVSKPIRRFEILLGKFLAFLINGAMMEAVALLLATYIMVQALGLEMFVYIRLLKLFPPLFLYSIIVMLIFGSMAAALSAAAKGRIKVILAMIILVIFIFFGFSVIRSFTISTGVYEKYGVYNYDVGYDLSNTYIMFIDKMTDLKPVPYIQVGFNAFGGVYDTSQPLYDADQGYIKPSLALNTYHSPWRSLATWIIIPALLLGSGLFMLEKREVY